MSLDIVLWYDTVDAKKLKVNAIDKTLKYIRLREQPTPAERDKRTAGNEFGLFPIKSIRAVYMLSQETYSYPKLATVLREEIIGTIFVEHVLNSKARDFT